MSAGESAKAEPTLKELAERLRRCFWFDEDTGQPTGFISLGWQRAWSVVQDLERSPPAAERTALKELRDGIEADRKKRWKTKPSHGEGPYAWAKQQLIEDLEDQRILKAIDAQESHDL